MIPVPGVSIHEEASCESVHTMSVYHTTSSDAETQAVCHPSPYCILTMDCYVT